MTKMGDGTHQLGEHHCRPACRQRRCRDLREVDRVVEIRQCRPEQFVAGAIAVEPRRRDRRDVLALLAPGQGAQKPGMLTPWLDLPGAESRVRWLSAVAGLDLLRLGTAADAEEIRDTAVTQPLI